MSLYVDKYRPLALQDLDYHPQVSLTLERLAASGDFPHLLMYGPSGAGKKTRIMAVLKAIYGNGVEKLKMDSRQFTTPSNRKIDMTILSSNYHIELTPSDVGMYDRVVIQDLIKEIAQTQQVDTSSKRAFKVVVLNDCDSLTRDAQAALRRTMEKYMKNLRIILCCTSTSKIIAPIRSRCLLVRVAAPSASDLCSILYKVSDKEGMDLPQSFASKIVQKCDGNLRKALLMLEAARVQQYPFSETQQVLSTDWEMFIQEIANSILTEQTPNRLLQIRGQLYDLLSHCLPAELILKTLCKALLQRIDNDMKPRVMTSAAEFDHRLKKGSKAIFHLEAFVAQVMSLYKRYLVDLGVA